MIVIFGGTLRLRCTQILQFYFRKFQQFNLHVVNAFVRLMSCRLFYLAPIFNKPDKTKKIQRYISFLRYGKY